MISSFIIIGYIIFTNWKNSSEEMLEKIQNSVNRDILGKIDEFVSIPLQTNITHNRIITDNIVDFNNNEEVYNYLNNVMISSKLEIYGFLYGTENGDYYGSRRDKDTIETFIGNAQNSGYDRQLYSSNLDLLSKNYQKLESPYDPRKRVWYIKAKEEGKPVFSPIYQYFNVDDYTLSATYPIYKDGSLQGVLATHIILSDLNTYLSKILNEKNVATYIIEKETGYLVANFLEMPNIINNSGKIVRIPIEETNDEAVITAYKRYKSGDGSNQLIKTSSDTKHFKFTEYNQNGLEWLVITAIPESHFTADLYSSIKQTIFLCLLVLLLAVFISVKMTNNFLKPIYNLLDTTESFSNGNLSARAGIVKHDEIGKLSVAFNKMADELNLYINNLESIVKDRTLELEQKNSALLKATIEADKAIKAKSEFVSNMSHEIRTPIHGIIGYLDILSRTNLSKDQQIISTNIEIASNMLLSIINNILDFSKIEAGMLSMNERPFNVTCVVEESVSLVNGIAKEKGLIIQKNISPTIPITVLGDSVRLKQILTNLLSNAIKFTERGYIRLSVDLVADDEDSLTINFIVSDTGCGISEQHLNIIFDAFTQGDSSITKAYEGTGLGLTICKELVELMGGEIKVKSKLNVGTTFSFTIRVKKYEQIKSENPVINTNGNSQNVSNLISLKQSKRYDILIVDDNEMNRMVAQKILELPFIHSETAENGKEALDKLSNKKYDLIFMDCQMPILDGYEATKLIRASENKTNHTPIIAMTAYAFENEIQKCLTSGMDAFITKPFKRNDLIPLLFKYLGYSANFLEHNLNYGSCLDHYDDIIRDITNEVGFNELEAKALIYNFIDGLEEKYNLLMKHIEDGDIEKIISILHALKGTSASLRMYKLSAYLEKIKSDVINNNFETLYNLPDYETIYEIITSTLKGEKNVANNDY